MEIQYGSNFFDWVHIVVFYLNELRVKLYSFSINLYHGHPLKGGCHPHKSKGLEIMDPSVSLFGQVSLQMDMAPPIVLNKR